VLQDRQLLAEAKVQLDQNRLLKSNHSMIALRGGILARKTISRLGLQLPAVVQAAADLSPNASANVGACKACAHVAEIRCESSCPY
jgi:hypothetical protein